MRLLGKGSSAEYLAGAHWRCSCGAMSHVSLRTVITTYMMEAGMEKREASAATFANPAKNFNL